MECFIQKRSRNIVENLHLSPSSPWTNSDGGTTIYSLTPDDSGREYSHYIPTSRNLEGWSVWTHRCPTQTLFSNTSQQMIWKNKSISPSWWQTHYFITKGTKKLNQMRTEFYGDTSCVSSNVWCCIATSDQKLLRRERQQFIIIHASKRMKKTDRDNTAKR